MTHPILLRADEVAERCALSASKPDAGGRSLALEFEWIRAAGLLGAVLPPLSWGSEPGTWSLLLHLLRLMGRGNLSVGRIFEGHVNALQLLLQYGSAAQIAAAEADVKRGCLYGVWNTEAPGDGLSLLPLGGDQYRLMGAKTFASGASLLQRVFANAARPDGGWQMCLVPLDRASVERDVDSWQPIGMRATESIRVDFTGVEIGAEALIGKPGDYLREPWFSGGAIRFAAVQLGGIEAVAETTRQFLRELGRGGDPYQAARAGETAALLETGRLWLEGAAEQAEQAETHPEAFVHYVGLLRRTIERIGLEVMEHAVRSAGARALLRPLPLERQLRDLTMYLRQPAPDEVLARAGRWVNESPLSIDRLWG